MATDKALIEKREELKGRLAAGEFKTLVDVTLDKTGQLIQKITRNSQSVSHWSSSTVLYLFFLLLVGVGLFLLGEASSLREQFSSLPSAFIPMSFLIGYFNVVIVVAGNNYIHKVFTAFYESVISSFETVTTLVDFKHWLSFVCNRKLHFIFSIIVGVILGLYQVFELNAVGANVLWSAAIGSIILNTFAGFFLYLLFHMITLSARIRNYHLKLDVTYPASSEVVSRLSDLLGGFVYLVAIYATIVTFFVAIQQLLVQLSGFVILLFWLPILGLFVINQSSLSRIIQRSKQVTLNEIQAELEQLHSSEKLGEKETMETINRLMDYFDRIKRSSNSRIDSGAVLNLINSLILPLVALLIGNMDKLLALLK